MMTYLLQTGLVWTVLFLFYHFALKKHTFFQWNRLYLLVSLCTGLVLPFVDRIFTSDYSIYQYEYVASLQEIAFTAAETGQQNHLNWMAFLYWFGVVLAFLRFLYGIVKILQLKRNSEVKTNQGYVEVMTNSKHLPFSFFNWVFISKLIPFNDKLDSILNHEKVHIQQKHSMDIVFIEVIRCFFWMNPILYFFKKELKNNHEYFADEVVTQSVLKTAYQTLLISQSPTGIEVQLAHQFFQSHIKNRIKMLYTKKSKKSSAWVYGFMVPVVFGMVLLLSGFKPFEESTLRTFNEFNYSSYAMDTLPPKPPRPSKAVPPPPPPPPPPPAKEDDVFKVVEQMPRFPGCEDSGKSMNDRKDCSQTKMLQYIYKNLTYPTEAKEKGVEGTAVVNFIVKKNGDIKDVKIIRDPGSGLGEETKRVVESMNDMEEKWTPGIQRGKPVNVLFTLPVKFKLDSDDKKKKK